MKLKEEKNNYFIFSCNIIMNCKIQKKILEFFKNLEKL